MNAKANKQPFFAKKTPKPNPNPNPNPNPTPTPNPNGAQLRALVARGFDTHTAAPYCDGQSTVEALATLIASDAAALEEETANPRLRTPRSSSRAKASVGGGSGSSACVIS